MRRWLCGVATIVGRGVAGLIQTRVSISVARPRVVGIGASGVVVAVVVIVMSHARCWRWWLERDPVWKVVAEVGGSGEQCVVGLSWTCSNATMQQWNRETGQARCVRICESVRDRL